ncbi:hypothetical protein QVM54_29840, partial [Pseudomonas aeruginosa]|uniref:hypothetical protein n=1 Tax=Pseudomonas aeruginosa TaxID=287 RepID=UPI003523B979
LPTPADPRATGLVDALASSKGVFVDIAFAVGFGVVCVGVVALATAADEAARSEERRGGQ